MKWIARLASVSALLFSAPGLAAEAPRYATRTLGDVVQLRDRKTDTVVSILTPVSNAYEMVVHGHNVLRMTIKSVDDMRARPGLNGVPLLAPFANRLDDTAFFANGRRYAFDLGLGNVRGPIPIHGYLSGASAWKVLDVRSDRTGAWITSRLDFYRNPLYMAQFPFAHTLTMTYRLSDEGLEVSTRIDNLSDEPMPVSIGFHPYFQLTDSVRDDWTLDVPAATHWKLAPNKTPTGETEPASEFFGTDPHAVPLKRFSGRDIDDIFTDLERDARGRATVSLSGTRQKISVILGPKFKTALVYTTQAPAPPRPASSAPQAAPPSPVSQGPAIPLSATAGEPAPAERGFVAVEPMVGVTNAMNLAQKGLYKDLQSIAPGGSWQESFWIRPSGY